MPALSDDRHPHLRRKQKEHQVHRLIVHRIEIDRMIELREQAGHLFHAGDAAMRNCNPLPHPGGTELLAFGQRFEDAPLRKSA